MKKLVTTLAVIVILALAGLLGWRLFSPDSPRERLTGADGSSILSEELSYYLHGKKAFGKVYKPCDENGNFPDSLGTRPVVAFLHEPLKTAFPVRAAQRLAAQGVIAYVVSCDGQGRTARGLAGKVRGERFTDPDLFFLVADAFNAKAAVEAALRLQDKVAGMVLTGPQLDEKDLRRVTRLPYEVLSLDPEAADAAERIGTYLEEHGAMK